MSHEPEQEGPYDGPERRETPWLSKRQIDEIAERAAAHALTKVYTEVGRSVVKSALWIIGAGCLAVLAWLAATGRVKL